MSALGCDLDSSSGEIFSEVDLERGGEVVEKLHSGKKKKRKKAGRDCRICHLGLESNDFSDEEEGGEYYGVPIQLGCSCKGDLGAAHKKCAETWFKIKGNMTCEICGTTALNVANEQANHTNNTSAATQLSAAAAAPVIPVVTQSIWRGRRVMNVLLAGMVFAFIISWLFHFKVLK